MQQKTRCFLSYEEQSSSESDWDEAGGTRRCQGDPAAEDVPGHRPYCQCGKPLRRVAKLPGHAVLLTCGTSYDCARCDDTILAGELHFRCSKCETLKVCRDCGPGVYIARSFDYFDRATGESQVQEIPSSVIHQRKARLERRRKSRSATLDEVSAARELAFEVVENTRELCDEVMAEGGDRYDSQWGEGGLLLRLLGAEDPVEASASMRLLADATRSVVAAQPIVTDVKVPCKVFGDLHGQLRDFLLLCGSFGFPGTPECPSVVFNGDFVDRGKHQVEVCAALFALKIAYPKNVFLNRGNHEDAMMNAKYGFQKECLVACGDEHGPGVFEAISATFMQLPLASLIAEKILVVHGGIGDGKWTLSDLRRVRRPLNHAQLQNDDNQWIWNILWSDPIEDDQAGTNVFGVHGSPRGRLAVKFGWNVTQAFCARNGLDLVIRSHQAKKGGLGFDVMHNESLIRVFSARDYEGHHNDSAVLLITDSEEADGASGGVLNVRPQVLSSLRRDE